MRKVFKVVERFIGGRHTHTYTNREEGIKAQEGERERESETDGRTDVQKR